jgi:hypothetical protein
MAIIRRRRHCLSIRLMKPEKVGKSNRHCLSIRLMKPEKVVKGNRHCLSIRLMKPEKVVKSNRLFLQTDEMIKDTGQDLRIWTFRAAAYRAYRRPKQRHTHFFPISSVPFLGYDRKPVQETHDNWHDILKV